jgi:hypothetical protein
MMEHFTRPNEATDASAPAKELPEHIQYELWELVQVNKRAGWLKGTIRTALRAIPLKALEMSIAITAIGVSTWTSYLTYEVQRSARDAQLIYQKTEQETSDRNEQLALFAQCASQINLRSTEGRAAYGVCLNAAIQLDKTPGPLGYVTLLPQYSVDNLIISLRTNPKLLALALKYGPKPVEPQGIGNLYYVVVGAFAAPPRGEVRAFEMKLRDQLNEESGASEYSLELMSNRSGQGMSLVVGGLQSFETAVEIRATVKRLDPGLAPVIVGAAHLLRSKAA